MINYELLAQTMPEAAQAIEQLQLEVKHCRACCDELRAKIPQAIEHEAMLIATAEWTPTDRAVALSIAATMRARAALIRAGGGV